MKPAPFAYHRAHSVTEAVALLDTAAQPYGTASWASRTTVVGGSAVHQARTRRPGTRPAARVCALAALAQATGGPVTGGRA